MLPKDYFRIEFFVAQFATLKEMTNGVQLGLKRLGFHVSLVNYDTAYYAGYSDFFYSYSGQNILGLKIVPSTSYMGKSSMSGHLLFFSNN